MHYLHKCLVALLPLFVFIFATAEESKPLADAGIVTCEESNPEVGPSQWVTSKKGYSAAVEIHAVVTGTGKRRLCRTSWVLHLRGPEGKRSAITVAEREDYPDDEEWVQENSFEIDAWSKDGNMVLVSQIQAQGDWDETTPVVFDFASHQHWRTDLYPLFKTVIPPGCFVVYRALRFAEDNRVLISAMSTDDDREPRAEPCFPDSLWQLDFRHNNIARLIAKPSKNHQQNILPQSSRNPPVRIKQNLAIQ